MVLANKLKHESEKDKKLKGISTMLKLRQITFVTIALIGISQIRIPIAFAEIDRSWRPQLSGKILLLPVTHMNNAI